MWALVAWASLTGCVEFAIDPIADPTPPQDVVVVDERFVQAPLPAVDVLMVVDGSRSMAQERAELNRAAADLFGALDGLGLAWQLGVVSTDVEIGGGQLRGSPWILTPATLDRLDAFTRMTAGFDAPGERGLDAATLALSLAVDGENVGFRRHNAALHVVFVSDGDDEGDVAIDAFVEQIAADGARWGGPWFISAVVGDLPSGCSSIRGSAGAGERYTAAAVAGGGAVASICAADYGSALEEIGAAAVTLPDRFPLERVPSADPIVRVDGELMADGWWVDAAGPWLVFERPPSAGARIDVSYPTRNTVAPAATR